MYYKHICRYPAKIYTDVTLLIGFNLREKIYIPILNIVCIFLIYLYILSIRKIDEAAVPINHARRVERENFFGRRQWFPWRKEHRRRGTARKIANWYMENINKTAVRIPMIYCKV